MPRVPLPRPSIQTGYARSPGESEYPELWEGVVGRWPLGLQGSGSTLYDFSPRRFDALQQSNTTWVNGLPRGGRVVDFDGTSDYHSANGPQNILGGATNATLAAWFYRESSGHTVAVGFGTESYRFNFIWWSDGKVYFQAENNNGSFPNAALSGSGWHHIVCAYNGNLAGLSRLAVRIDGVGVTLTSGGADPVSFLGSSANLGNFFIGKGQGTRYSNGKIDDVYLYNRTFLASESDLLYDTLYAPFVPRRRIYGFTVAGAPAFPPNSLALTGVGR